MTVKQIHETASTLAATPVAGKPGRLLVTLITPGQGSSGYYSSEVLEAAASDRVFAAGTPMFLDHPTETEKIERPVRSVKDLAAVLAEDARWDDHAQALVAEADVFTVHRQMLDEMQGHIGTSIRASADVAEATSGGRPVIERLVTADSVDFVTKAGRGGSFRVLEHARPAAVEARAVRRGVAESTVNDQREALDSVLKAAHGADKTWVWLRDFDATTAWFEISTDDSEKTYSQSYTTGEDGLATAMTGERTEVRQVTKYVPVSRPGDSTTEESEEDTMPQIEEARLRQLEADAGRVTALESERDKHRAEAEEAATKVSEAERRANVAEARLAATSVARARVVAENADLAPATVDRIVAEALRDVPLTESGQLDADALHERTDKAREAEESYLAGLAATAGAGTPTGFGKSTGDTAVVSESDIDKAIAQATGRQIKEA